MHDQLPRRLDALRKELDLGRQRTQDLEGQLAQLRDTMLQLVRWVMTYPHDADGRVGPKTSAYSGYQVQFLTHPHVTATVIIYDR